MKIWVDDVRSAPEGYFHCHSVNEAISTIKFTVFLEKLCPDRKIIEVIDLDHDACQFYSTCGGKYRCTLTRFLKTR